VLVDLQPWQPAGGPCRYRSGRKTRHDGWPACIGEAAGGREIAVFIGGEPAQDAGREFQPAEGAIIRPDFRSEHRARPAPSTRAFGEAVRNPG